MIYLKSLITFVVLADTHSQTPQQNARLSVVGRKFMEETIRFLIVLPLFPIIFLKMIGNVLLGNPGYKNSFFESIFNSLLILGVTIILFYWRPLPVNQFEEWPWIFAWTPYLAVVGNAIVLINYYRREKKESNHY